MKRQLDATLCRFYFCSITLHVSGASAHHQDYLKLVQRLLVYVLSLQVSHHISLLGPYETPTWCNTVQVLFLQYHSTCFGRKRPSSGVFKTSTAATGICVIVAGKSSHLLIRAVWNTNLMQHCAGFISAVSIYMFRAQAPIIRII